MVSTVDDYILKKKKSLKMELLLKDCGVICVFTIHKVGREVSGDKLNRLKIRKLKRQHTS